MVLGRRKTYTKTNIKTCSPRKIEPAKEEPQTLQNTPWGYFAKFGFFLGRLPFWR